MKTPLHGERSRAGFTLLELLMTVVMLGTFLWSLLLVVTQGTHAARDGMALQSTQALGRRTLDRMARELACAVAGTLDPNPTLPWGSDDLTFQVVGGYSAGAVQLDTPVLFALELEQGELDDGADNDGDGLVDERQLVYTRDPDGAAERSVWAHGVREYLEGEVANGLDDNGNGLQDEAGLCFVHRGGTLVLRLSLEERAPQGQIEVCTVQTTVRLRN